MANDGAEEVRCRVMLRAALPLLRWLSAAAQVVLEAETTNQGALRLYARAGFVRDKRLGKYYLSGADAYRLKLLLPSEGDGSEHEVQ